MLEGLSKRILSLCHRLEFSKFIPLEIREKLQRELEQLIKKREKYHEHNERMANEERSKLKDPNR